MSLKQTQKKINILIVARWPLGGIRTYMRYTFRHLPPNYCLTVIATSTLEDEALRHDVAEYAGRLLISGSQSTIGLFFDVFRELLRKRYDVILSQGFISGFAVYLANLFFGRSHVLTLHGILEPRLLVGKFQWLKRKLLERMLLSLSVIYAVSKDMLDHLYEQFPNLEKCNRKTVVIPNGIEMTEFEVPSLRPDIIRKQLAITPETFVFGFFGRFMPQKGFDLLIESVAIISQGREPVRFKILAVGSGDYLPHYQRLIREQNLEQFFHFLPFQSNIRNLYLEVDMIVMPSRWEASGLLAMEALSMGVPLISSDCIGLRETTADTPAQIFLSENVDSLAQVMLNALQNRNVVKFQEFMPIARQRFDVAASAGQLVRVIEDTVC